MRGAVRTAPSIWEVAGQTFEIITVVPGHFFGDEEIWLDNSRVLDLSDEPVAPDERQVPASSAAIALDVGSSSLDLASGELGEALARPGTAVAWALVAQGRLLTR
jgi:hypothetical protein